MSRKTVGYGRVSTLEQKRKETIVTQEEKVNQFCSFKDIHLDHFFKDEGFSGTKEMEERPDGAALMQMIAAGDVERLIVYRLDRLARRPLIIHKVLEKLKKAGGTFISATEGYDTSTREGRLFIGITALFAEWELESIRERTYDAKCGAVEKGFWPGGCPPIGYIIVDKKMVVDEYEAAIVRRIFNSIVWQHQTIYSLMAELNRERLPVPPRANQPTSQGWRRSTIRKILLSSTYKGEHLYRPRDGNPVVIECPPIIDPATWDQAHKLLTDARRWSKGNTRRVYPLQGLIYCYCGRRLQGRAPYYTCPGRTHPGGPGLNVVSCDAPYVLMKRVEDQIWADICRFAEDPDAANEAFLADLGYQRQNVDGINQRIDDLENQLDKLEEKRRRIQELFFDGMATKDDVRKRLTRLDAERDDLAFERDDRHAGLILALQEEADGITMREILAEMGGMLNSAVSPEERQRIFRKAVCRIDVRRDGTFDARYRFDASMSISITSSGRRERDKHSLPGFTVRYSITTERRQL